jgi:hypothetical protein
MSNRYGRCWRWWRRHRDRAAESAGNGPRAGDADLAGERGYGPAAVAVEEIFAGVDIERRQALFEFFEILAHGAVASGCERKRRWPAFPGKDGGWRNFLRALRAREPAELESAKTKAQLGDPPEHQVPATE